MLISVTPDARARLADIKAHRRAMLDERLRDWTEDDLQVLVTALGRYNRALEPETPSG